MDATTTENPTQDANEQGFVRGLGLLDSTMIVAGSMIGSGIFIVSADIARQVGSGGWLLAVWLVTGLLTVAAALSYGELAAMMPKAGGQYVYLREAYSPFWGFLYGWTLFLVIQTGTIAAVGVGFARFLGVLIPSIAADNYLIKPLNLGASYAVSLSTQQFVAILMIIVLTIINMQGLQLGKIIQNVFTSAKTLALFALIVLGLLIGSASGAFSANFASLWTPQNVAEVAPGISAANGLYGLFIAFCVAQVGSLFSSDAWNNITFTAGEVKNPQRNIPLSLALGTGLVIGLYVLANVAYLVTLSLNQIQTAPDDRVGTLALQQIFGSIGATIMAIAIIVSTFGCNNGLILAGARVYYAMAKDDLFFDAVKKLNKNHVPATALILQCVWTCILVLPRTVSINKDACTGVPFITPPSSAGVIIGDNFCPVIYGNLYGTLLDYVVFAVLIFYVLTIAGLFVLRRARPNAARPYRAIGYPVIPALYIVAATVICVVLLFYKTQTSLPGLAIVLTGVPVYFIWRATASKRQF